MCRIEGMVGMGAFPALFSFLFRFATIVCAVAPLTVIELSSKIVSIDESFTLWCVGGSSSEVPRRTSSILSCASLDKPLNRLRTAESADIEIDLIDSHSRISGSQQCL